MLVRFQVFKAASMKITVVWDVAPCSLVDIDRRFRGIQCLHNHGLVAETLLIFYQTARHMIPEDSLHTF
jgi:hypothetical protein